MPPMFWPNSVTKVHGFCQNVFAYKNPWDSSKKKHDFPVQKCSKNVQKYIKNDPEMKKIGRAPRAARSAARNFRLAANDPWRLSS
jgi:hypothetical protein